VGSYSAAAPLVDVKRDVQCDLTTDVDIHSCFVASRRASLTLITPLGPTLNVWINGAPGR